MEYREKLAKYRLTVYTVEYRGIQVCGIPWGIPWEIGETALATTVGNSMGYQQHSITAASCSTAALLRVASWGNSGKGNTFGVSHYIYEHYTDTRSDHTAVAA